MKGALILVFGITGDLSKRKLIPGLYRLMERGKLDQCRIIGAAIEDMQPQEILAQAKPFVDNLNQQIWQKLVDIFSYCKIDINHFIPSKSTITFLESIFSKNSRTVLSSLFTINE